jgi:hypothetical protein
MVRMGICKGPPFVRRITVGSSRVRSAERSSEGGSIANRKGFVQSHELFAKVGDGVKG